MEDATAPLKSVTGEVYKRSILKTIGSIVFLIFLFFFGLLLVWAWWTGATFQRLGEAHTVTWWGLLIGIGSVLGSPILIVSLIRRALLGERLIIGSDRLQIVRTQGGRDVVRVQIPFANVAECSYEVTESERRIGIDVANPSDPATYVQGEQLAANKELRGWHYILEGGYQTGVAAIHKKLAEKMEQRNSK